jgi:hypothetical protein
VSNESGQQLTPGLAATTTVVTTSGSPSFLQAPVTFIATITSAAGAIPDGETVTFLDDGVIFGTSITAAGVASLTTSAIPTGSRTIKAAYSGDATFSSSAGIVTQVVTKYPSSVTFIPSVNPSVYEQAVSLTATVTSGEPGGPTGSVTFRNGTHSLGTVQLNTGTAVLLTANLPVGSLSLTANYAGDAVSTRSSAALIQVVNQAPSTTVLTSSANPSTAGQLVTLAAAVSPPPGPYPGSITFFEGATVLGTVKLIGTAAKLDSSTLLAGSQTITAVYSGNTNVTSGSAQLTQIVGDSPGGLQPQFFAMAVASAGNMPTVSYGTLSHPPGGWTSIESTGRGIYNFSTIDAYVANAPKDGNGVSILDLALGWTPGWAVSDQTNCILQKTGFVACTVPPDNLQDWTDFVTALINHYNGTTAPHIKYYEIWSEANSPSFWTAGVDALVNMASLAYPILKSDPYSSVFTPSVIWRKGNGPAFMTAYLQAGGSSVADGVTFHGYTSSTGRGVTIPVPWPESPQSTTASIETMISTYRQVEDSNGLQGQPLMTTEGGWGVGGVVDPDQQSAWITHYEIVQAGLAASNNLLFQTWWSWGDPTMGVICTTQDTPTQAGYAYQLVYSWLVNNQPSACAVSGTIWSCPLSNNLIVWDDSQNCSNGTCTTSVFTPPTGYSQYIDLTGAVWPINGTIPLGVKPIMLEP